MCVVSMVIDHYRERWEPIQPQPQPYWPWIIVPQPPAIAPEEVAEFRRLLERAREYDKRHAEPDCELEEKKAALKAIAEKLGVDISFVDASST